MATENKTRPYWHVDAKWIAGVLLFCVLATTLLFASLFRLTDRGTTVRIVSTLFSDPAAAAALGGGNTEKVREIGDKLYDGGAAGMAAAITSDPAQQAELKKQVGPFDFFTKGTHQTLQVLTVVGIILSLLLTVPLVLFSAGAGRFVSPGVVLLLASGPALPLWLLSVSKTAKPTDVSGQLLPLITGRLAMPYLTTWGLALALFVAAITFKVVWRRTG